MATHTFKVRADDVKKGFTLAEMRSILDELAASGAPDDLVLRGAIRIGSARLYEIEVHDVPVGGRRG